MYPHKCQKKFVLKIVQLPKFVALMQEIITSNQYIACLLIILQNRQPIN